MNLVILNLKEPKYYVLFLILLWISFIILNIFTVKSIVTTVVFFVFIVVTLVLYFLVKMLF